MNRRDTPVVFVDSTSILSPTRFVSDLADTQAIAGFDVESELERIGERHVAFTTVPPAVGRFLEEQALSYDLLVIPQEDFSGLTEELVRRARRVVVAGNAHEVSPLVTGSQVHLLKDACFIRERALPEPAESYRADGSSSIVNLLFPYSYLDFWEELVARGELPGEINVLTDRRTVPPTWFEQKAEAHGTRLSVHVWGPTALDRFCALPGRLVRDNPAVDAIDLEMLDRPRAVHNLRHGRDLRADVAPDRVTSWTRLLEELRMKGDDEIPSRDGTPRDVFSTGDPASAPRLNVVCFNPTYLFADLVARFERAGCVPSDFPIADADAYIWMRPQELAAYADHRRRVSPVDVGPTWIKRLESAEQELPERSVGAVEARSVAIHHGTCSPPIVQFDSYHLAKRLATAGAVAGVCELERCYGPSARFANPHNFELVPIGYDHRIFTEELIRSETREPDAPLRIGFVGRAYGTTSREQLARSPYAHPKGYRKGGDILLNVLLRLASRKVRFELHVVGKHWEELVEQCEGHEMDVVYYARDENITYQQFPSVFSSFDVLMITARCEGGPVAAIEAMSVGVPVVGTDVGLLPYLSSVSEHVHTFRYDTDWHVADLAGACDHLERLAHRPLTVDDRHRIRESIAHHTTDRWVERVCELATVTARAPRAWG